MLLELAEKNKKTSFSSFSRSNSLLSENSDSRDSSENDASLLAEDGNLLDAECSMLNNELSMQHVEIKEKAYQERRRKNNLAAKRSRDARRAKEDEISIRAAFLGMRSF